MTLMPAWALESSVATERYRVAHSHGFRAAWGYLEPKMQRAEAAADRLWFELRNPDHVREQVSATLRALEVAEARVRGELDNRAMQSLSAIDPVEYRQLALLRLTDSAAFTSRIEWLTGRRNTE
jgi:hypothetical protein